MRDFKDSLLEELSNIKGSGQFVSINTLPFVLPGLKIKGLGELSFPLTEEIIKNIISFANKSPFGLGMETIYDDNVRKGWEIDAENIQFKNPEWEANLQKAIKQLKKDLGIEKSDIKADLYKLLIYEEGSFFLKHKDTEKEKGMFGTLVVGLPSYYEGGEFEISFDGETVISDFSEDKAKYELNYTAFYADCDHEVKLVKAGYRVVLTYNLIQESNSSDNQNKYLGSAPIVERISTLLRKQESLSQQQPFVFLLDHQYTPESFAKSTLKLNDRYKSSILLEVGEKLGYYSGLCLITSYVNGSPGYDGYIDYEDIDDDSDIDEIYDEYLEVGKWLNPFIPKPTNLAANEDDFISPYDINQGDPIEKDNTGYMGNWGPEIEHWYHYGAVILWSKEANAKNLLSCDIEEFLRWIAYFNDAIQMSEIEEKAIETVILRDMLNLSSGQSYRYKSNLNSLADWLIKYDKANLLSKLNSGVLNEFIISISLEKWIDLLKNLASNEVIALLKKIENADNEKLIVKWINIFNALKREHLWKEEYGKFSILLSDVTSKAYAENNVLISRESLIELFYFQNNLTQNEAWGKDSFNFLKSLDKTNFKYLHSELFPALFESDSNNDLFINLIEFWKQHLEEREKEIPLPPTNWKRKVPKNAPDDKIWKALSAFLLSPDQEILDIKERKNIREEYEANIKYFSIDVRGETITKGSPHTLRLFKTQKNYDKDKRNWNEDMKWLKLLKKKV